MSLIGRALTVLLVLSVIPLAFLTPGSRGQGVTTVTNLQTITTVVSETSTEVSIVQSTSTSTVTTLYTMTSYSNKTLGLLHQTLSLEPPTQEHCGLYDRRSFSARANQVISINLTSNIPIDFFVMSSKDYGAWVAAQMCPVTSALVEQYSVDSVTMELMISESGSYYFVFLNTSHDTTAKIQLMADIVGVAIPLSVEIATEVLSTSQSATIWTFPVTITRVLTSVHTEQIPPSPGQNNMTLVAIVGIAVLIAVVLLVMRVRGKTAAKTKSPVVPIPVETGQLCHKCGSKIPSGSKFCEVRGTEL